MKVKSGFAVLLVATFCVSGSIFCSCSKDENIVALSSVGSVSGGDISANVREYVDLGLPSGTLWATCNIGAWTPEEYGCYFAWGETQPKTNYTWSTYKWCDGSYNTMTKYVVSDNPDDAADNKTELDAADDAATAIWGSEWQMPSLAQIQELYNSNYTTTVGTIQNGVFGRKITSKINEKSIFLPAAGYGTGTIIGAGERGNYWSRSLTTTNCKGAYYLNFLHSGVFYWGNYDRYYGFSVRPVRVL